MSRDTGRYWWAMYYSERQLEDRGELPIRYSTDGSNRRKSSTRLTETAEFAAWAVSAEGRRLLGSSVEELDAISAEMKRVFA